MMTISITCRATIDQSCTWDAGDGHVKAANRVLKVQENGITRGRRFAEACDNRMKRTGSLQELLVESSAGFEGVILRIRMKNVTLEASASLHDCSAASQRFADDALPIFNLLQEPRLSAIAIVD